MTLKDSWNSQLYDQQHQFVSRHGESLIDLLKPKPGEKILDIGCGTGDLAQEITTYGASIVGVDKSLNMVNQARKKFPDLTFQAGDATELTFSNEFDAVFSNATLHWVKEPEKALSSIFQSLKKGGRLVAELGGQGNCQTLTDSLIRGFEKTDIVYNQEFFPWFFPSIGDYLVLMEKSGFNVIYGCYFDRPTPLVDDQGLENWLNMFASSFFEGVSDTEKREIVKQVQIDLAPKLYQDNQWILDYKRIRVIGIKD
ncbi:methyltransferase domain-containing protein [Vagococcus sp. BWB3-3]|uniref:Methyltransferase domain-containing protein n=1 Tax=Vagococcus allomyrinae TaxID=2794353 RepID=A0A940PB45_9ENTE|nr:class I SAM-dependent methyltransferase [Vagococcus allomyrinae]MBP1040773.1 methyltransferase domain-containing protein [Vagococcus allomyrinae]